MFTLLDCYVIAMSLHPILTWSLKNHFTESLIELNITGTLPDEVDQIATVSKFGAMEPTFSGFSIFFCFKSDVHVLFIFFQVFHSMLPGKAGDFEK